MSNYLRIFRAAIQPLSPTGAPCPRLSDEKQFVIVAVDSYAFGVSVGYSTQASLEQAISNAGDIFTAFQHNCTEPRLFDDLYARADRKRMGITKENYAGTPITN